MAFKVSELAKLDINDIYEYSVTEFGIQRTIRYLMEMEECFFTISKHHHLGATREHIADGLFAFPYQSHVIFYKIIKEQHITIERILHGSRDIPATFNE